MTAAAPFRLLVTGAAGQLGSDLMLAASTDPDVFGSSGLTRSELDITDAPAVRAVVADQAAAARDHRLVIVNSGAWTDVDGAESDEAGAFAANATGPAALAAAAEAVGARLIHVSTDYVFDGTSTVPYEVDHPTAPVSAYGRTKAAGEQAVLALHPNGGYVVRTAWVYGLTGTNFVKTMLRLEGERETLTVVDDQVGSPTWSADLATGLLALAATQAPAGIYHATGGGETTWWGFARAIFAATGADPTRVQPCSSSEFIRPAPRPAYSVLSNSRWAAEGLPPLPHWEKSIKKALEMMGFPIDSG